MRKIKTIWLLALLSAPVMYTSFTRMNIKLSPVCHQTSATGSATGFLWCRKLWLNKTWIRFGAVWNRYDNLATN